MQPHASRLIVEVILLILLLSYFFQLKRNQFVFAPTMVSSISLISAFGLVPWYNPYHSH